MKWLRRILVLALILCSFTPVFAESRSSVAARQKAAVAQRNYQKRLAVARVEAAKKQLASAKRDLAKSSSTRKPTSTPAAPRGLDQNNAAAGLLLGAVLLGLSGNGGGFDFNASNNQDDYQEHFDRTRRYRMEYWEDRARQEAAAGNMHAAEQALQSAK